MNTAAAGAGSAPTLAGPPTWADEVPEMVSGAMRLAFNTYRPLAVLISQKVLGAKDFRTLSKVA